MDSGSSADIIFHDAYVQLGIDNAQLLKVNATLTDFSGKIIKLVGEVTLAMSLGSYPKRSTKLVKFLMVKALSAYNVILGRPSLNLLQAIACTFHLKLKFSIPNGMGEAMGDERIAKECYVSTLKRSREKLNEAADEKTKRKMTDGRYEMRDTAKGHVGTTYGEKRVEALEELKVILGEKTMKIGTAMCQSAKENLTQFLIKK
ncbi:UNVERIFIED_CONTAM: hypothetical protein Sindi_2742500 [Sesamum indicum]